MRRPADSSHAICPHLLVLEDNEDCRELLGLFLEMAGYRADLVEFQEDALRALERGGYDGVVTDCALGVIGESGVAFLEQAQARGLLGNLPAFIYTAYPRLTAPGALPACLAGVVIVEKPNVEELRRELDRVFMRGSHPQRASRPSQGAPAE